MRFSSNFKAFGDIKSDSYKIENWRRSFAVNWRRFGCHTENQDGIAEKHMVKEYAGTNEHIRMSFVGEFFWGGHLTIEIGNFMDNALEACREVEEGKRYILLSASYEKEVLMLAVVNPIAGSCGRTVPGSMSQQRRVVDPTSWVCLS